MDAGAFVKGVPEAFGAVLCEHVLDPHQGAAREPEHYRGALRRAGGSRRLSYDWVMAGSFS